MAGHICYQSKVFLIEADFFVFVFSLLSQKTRKLICFGTDNSWVNEKETGLIQKVDIIGD